MTSRTGQRDFCNRILVGVSCTAMWPNAEPPVDGPILPACNAIVPVVRRMSAIAPQWRPFKSAVCTWSNLRGAGNCAAAARGQKKGGQSRFCGGLDFTGLSRPHPSATYGVLPGGPLLLTLLYFLSSLMPETGTCATNMLDAGTACSQRARPGPPAPAGAGCVPPLRPTYRMAEQALPTRRLAPLREAVGSARGGGGVCARGRARHMAAHACDAARPNAFSHLCPAPAPVFHRGGMALAAPPDQSSPGDR